MKETEGSIRTYFIVAGCVAALLGFRDLGDIQKIPLDALPMSWTLALWFPTLTRIALGLGFVVAGVTVKSQLPRGATWIKTMLLISILVFVIDIALIASVVGTALGQEPIITGAVSVAIAAYLLASVRRLSAEAMARNPPIAKVV